MWWAPLCERRADALPIGRRAMNDTDLLGGVWLFDGLSSDQRALLAGQVREVTVAAGEWLLREGQEADSMYIVRSGRLDALQEGPPETLINRMRRGDVIGELALLHSGRRTASVKAGRDAVLLELSRSQFEALIREQPTFAMALTRGLAARLAVSHAPAGPPGPPRTIAVVRLDPAAPGPEAVEKLAQELGRAGTLIRLDPRRGDTDSELLDAIARAERDAERVLLVAGEVADSPAWNALCLREADTVLALTSGAADPVWLTRAAALRGCELLVGGPRATDALLAAVRPGQVQVVAERSGLGPALESTARRLTGRAVGVVLSGGGARAFAHLGVLEELCAAGVQIDRIAGVSLGALLAGAAASGRDIDELYGAVREVAVHGKPTGDYTLPVYALLRGRRLERRLAEYFGESRIEELPRRFFCISCDLIAREAVLHRTGLLRQAVYASLAIPGVLPPVSTSDGRLLVDGGVLDNLPVARMAIMREGPVIASDVTAQPGSYSQPARKGRARLTNFARRALTNSEEPLPRLGDTIVRSITVASVDTVAAARSHADLVITPAVGEVGMLDWKRIDAVREMGRRATREVLARQTNLPWS